MTVGITYNLDQAVPILEASGDVWMVTGELTFDTGAYVVNGSPIVPASFGLDTFKDVFLGGASVAQFRHYFVPGTDYVTGKIKSFIRNGSGVEAELTAVAMTAQAIPFVVVGRKAT